MVDYAYKLALQLNLVGDQCDQMIWKKLPIFLKVAKTVAKQNNAKLETIF